MATSSTESQVALIRSATLAFDLLLNNDLPNARSQFLAHPDSAAHGVGLGITAFLQAALGQEDAELATALEALLKAEAQATAAEKAAKGGKGKGVYPAGLEYKILTHDAVLSQALVHILTESYIEFTKAVWKLNRAYKGFKQVYQAVYPTGITETDSLADIFATLNAHYVTQTTSPTPPTSTSTGSSLLGSLGWGKKKAPASEIKHSSSAVALPALNRAKEEAAAAEAGRVAHSVPGSRIASRRGSVESLQEKLGGVGAGTSEGGGEQLMGEDGSFPAPLWKDDPVASLCVSGAFFGAGLFALIFSLLPPKMRRLIRFIGFTDSNRAIALKQLTVAAATGNDVHGYFSSLTLLTYYPLVLLMSGWQCEEKYLLDQCSIILNRIINRFPDGTLWVLNRAKLHRMRHETPAAITIIEDALAKGSSFREADSLLVFELSWMYLSNAEWIKAADSFERMCTLNNWSHSTYLAISSGCLIDLPVSERTPEIRQRITETFDKLPSLFGQKRLLGEPPTTEIFIMRRLEAEKVKHARWVAAGRLPKDSHYWESVRITFAMILGDFWATIGGRSPIPAVHTQIAHLSSFTPSPPLLPSESTTGLPTPTFSPSSTTAELDLDTPDELAMRDLLLGALYRSLNTTSSLSSAQTFLRAVVARGRDLGPQGVKEEKWVTPFALFELAVVQCKLGSLEEGLLSGEGEKEALEGVWRDKIARAEKLLEEVFAVVEYDLKSRLESRVIMLRDEIAQKKVKLGL